ncbi:ATP-binding protein [Actinomadura adrarensis]|uniref:ATP-binding protein n=1 Tax=Actinomadura adrarensis TaxID=1819600 RepID=A0ABW3CRZ8_9ACTN
MSVSPAAVQRHDTVPADVRPPRHEGGPKECVGVAALPTSIPMVRSFTRAMLTAWGLKAEYGWACQQVLSEFVTNAFDATGGHTVPEDLADLDEADVATIFVQLRVSFGRLIAEVRDSSAEQPQLADPELDDESGRGLHLATMLASDWGWYPTTGRRAGKVVWAAWDLDQRDAS